MMFPKRSNDVSVQNTEQSASGRKSYLFDFDKGDFVVRDGKLVECDGIAAIKVWIEKIIRTEKYRYPIYSDTEYGCHLEDLIIGNNYTLEFIEAELRREIEEALLQNPQITNVTGFLLTRDKGSITVSLEVHSGESGTDSITVTFAN